MTSTESPGMYGTGISRRRALAAIGSIVVTGTACSDKKERDVMMNPQPLTFGLITDLHYAEKAPNIGRHYADSADKLAQAVTAFSKRNVNFSIELGDFIDSAEKEIEYGYLKTINAVYDSFEGPHYYVLGNHDVATFSKNEFLAGVGAPKSYFSFDAGGYHFVVLDANFNPDESPYNAGNFTWTETVIPKAERDWLRDDLAQSSGRAAIVFTHQNLHDENDPHGVNNAPEIRSILEESGNVRAVFQGHMHSGGYAEINGIHYVTFRAAVEDAGIINNAYAIITIHSSGSITIEGGGRQESRQLAARQ